MLLYSCTPTLSRSTRIQKASQPQSLSIKATLQYKNPNTELQGKLHLRIQPDSLIWLSVRSIIEFELLRALITKEKIQVLSRLQKQYHSYTYDILSSYLGISLRYEWIERILLGKPMLEVSSYTELPASDSIRHLKGQALTLQVDTWIEAEDNRTLKQLLLDRRGYRMQIRYFYDLPKKPLPNSTLPLPRQVRIHLSHTDNTTLYDDWTIQLTYRKAKVLKEKGGNFSLKVPEGYERK